MKKQLNELSVEECYLFYKKTILNSNRIWKSAGVLANDEDYGGAVNKLITSVEELVKAIIMLADAKGFEFRKAEGMQSIILKSHSLRHFVGFGMLLLNLFISDFKKFFKKIKENQADIIEMYENKVSAENIAKKYMLKIIPILKDEFEWFSKVEKVRQQGTHVDLEEEIITPLSLTSKDYDEVFKRMNNVRYIGQEMIETLNSDTEELKQQLSKIKKKFIISDLYSNISKAIASTKNGRKNPFDLFGENFKDFDSISKVNN